MPTVTAGKKTCNKLLSLSTRWGFVISALRSGLLGRGVLHDTLKPMRESLEPDWKMPLSGGSTAGGICLHRLTLVI